MTERDSGVERLRAFAVATTGTMDECRSQGDEGTGLEQPITHIMCVGDSPAQNLEARLEDTCRDGGLAGGDQ